MEQNKRKTKIKTINWTNYKSNWKLKKKDKRDERIVNWEERLVDI